jgi:[ribosomal protein S18]-alanine N-acetyltransferase
VLRSYYEDSGEDAYLMNFRLDDMPDDEEDDDTAAGRITARYEEN